MDETISVTVATYGPKEPWDTLAMRALRSIDNQTRKPDEIHRVHGKTLHEARNQGILESKTKYAMILDADDEIEPRYIESMMGPAVQPLEIRYPMVRYINEPCDPNAPLPAPVALPARPIWRGNWMVIGSVIRRDVFIDIGGFMPWRALEDWDAWIRCWLVGCEPRLIPGAIYRAHRSITGRNVVSNPRALMAEIIKYNQEWQAKRKADYEANRYNSEPVSRNYPTPYRVYP